MDIIGCRFQEVMYQQKSTWRELVIFTERELEVLKQFCMFFIVSVSLLSRETVPTKWRPCQDTVMTTPAVTVENQEKAIQNKLKVLQLTNENTHKIAGSNLLKPIQRHRKLMESKVEECHEVKAIVPEVKIGRGDSWG